MADTFLRKKISSRAEVTDYVRDYPIFKDQVLLLYEFDSREIVQYRGPLRLLGFDHELINKFFIDSIVHPDELPSVKSIYRQLYEQVISTPANHKELLLSISFRIRRSDGVYYRINSQNQFLKPEDEEGLYLFAIVSDLNHLECKPGVYWHLKGSKRQKLKLSKECLKNQLFTKREIELIRYMAEGLDSKQIGINLNISAHTVNTHRKNMLKKMKFDKSIQLVTYAFRNNLF